MMALGAVLIVFLGSLIQRVTGMGLALVTSPFLVLVLGADLGVQTVQVVGVIVCAVSAWTLRRDLDVRTGLLLLGASVLGLVPGTLVARTLPAGWLSVVIGSVTVVALLLSVLVTRNRLFQGRAGSLVAGGLSGFMNVTAGVGGPPIVIYASSVRWPYASYVATVQLYFAALNALSLVGRGIPALTRGEWVLILVAALLGLALGNRVGARLDERVARPAVFSIALIGSVATIIRGIGAL